MKFTPPKHELRSITRAGNESSLNSRDKLIKSAEALFATKGFREVSVREIAAHAGVNSALVGYYFRGKQALFNEVYRSHARPLAQERLRRLAVITENKRQPTVEEVLRAWIIPCLRIGSEMSDKALHVRFEANLSSERWEHAKRASPFVQRANTAFVNALKGCLPFLSKETLMWRLHFIMGAITFGLRNPGPLRAFSRGQCDPTDLETLFAQILPFAVSGFSAPAPEIQVGSKQN